LLAFDFIVLHVIIILTVWILHHIVVVVGHTQRIRHKTWVVHMILLMMVRLHRSFRYIIKGMLLIDLMLLVVIHVVVRIVVVISIVVVVKTIHSIGRILIATSWLDSVFIDMYLELWGMRSLWG
jgi:hypothetical protein